MNKSEIKTKINEACLLLYEEKPDLMINKVHERTITSELAHNLKRLFTGWDVNVEYNREGNAGKPKQSAKGERLFPDIIIHKRGRRLGPNLAVIQAKGYWNDEDRSKDEEDLKKLRENYKYQSLYRLELNPESFELIEIN